MELKRRNKMIQQIFTDYCIPSVKAEGYGGIRHSIANVEMWFNNRVVKGVPIDERITDLVQDLMMLRIAVDVLPPKFTIRKKLVCWYFKYECMPLLDRKGHDYSQGSVDGHKNFKTMAARFKGRGIDAIDVIGIYLFKHIEAIQTYLQDGEVKSEPIEGRIADAVNYLLILYTALVEIREQADIPGASLSDMAEASIGSYRPIQKKS